MIAVAPADPNSKPRIRVLPTKPELQARDRSGPGPKQQAKIRVFLAGPQLRARDRSGPCPTGPTQQAHRVVSTATVPAEQEAAR